MPLPPSQAVIAFLQLGMARPPDNSGATLFGTMKSALDDSKVVHNQLQDMQTRLSQLQTIFQHTMMQFMVWQVMSTLGADKTMTSHATRRQAPSGPSIKAPPKITHPNRCLGTPATHAALPDCLPTEPRPPSPKAGVAIRPTGFPACQRSIDMHRRMRYHEATALTYNTTGTTLEWEMF